MSYTALYRKYRPQTFDDVIGQDHITQTLINQLKSERVGHAYLFTGSRGTGKTTCAKIFARAVNCLEPQNGSPCGKCKVCRALADASNIDIMEIDAASNNRVDEVREIRERVKYPPVNGKYKVYIIDEVHMLTDSAFNALLKTLEEPPSFVIFILATTEVHKLPATILSRCMRFDFRLVSADLLAQNIRRIFDAEGKTYEEEAVRYIAGAGEGSVRDSLSVADMCLSRSEGKLTLADVLDVLGAADRGKIRALTQSILQGDAREILLQIDALTNL
ncbi:MAG: DNA polymerase III subunit gamma/tau, partial [Clostridiales bacterium]|nr:DNA polymerase III subunit gamma/tau [Clostridiales bacterium]